MLVYPADSTSVIIKWIVEKYGCEVIAFSADIGQGSELKGLKERPKTGAKKILSKT